MLLATSIGEDLFRAILQGTPPGTVYALDRARLRPHLQDVRRVQPGLRGPGLHLGRDVLPGPARVGLGDPRRRFVLSVFVAGARCRAAARATDLPPPPHRLVGGQAGRRPRALGRAAGPVRRCSSTSRPSPAAPRPASCPTGPTCSTTRSASTPSAATSWWPWSWPWSAMAGLARAVPVHRHRPAHAGGGGEPADDRAQRHLRRPGVGVQLGAVEPVRRAGRRAHRPAFNTLAAARLLQPGRGRHRRRRRRSAGQPARGPCSAASASASSSRCSTPSCPAGRDDYTLARADPGQHHARRMPFVVLFGVLVLLARPSARAREVTDPLSGVDPPPPSLRRRPGAADLTRATRVFAVVFFGVVGLRRVHPGRRRRGCSSSPRP